MWNAVAAGNAYKVRSLRLVGGSRLSAPDIATRACGDQ